MKKEDGALVVENYLPRLKPGGIYLWSKAAPLYNLDGAVVGAVQILRDVTEIRLLEEKRALAAQRDRLTGLFVLDYFMNEVSRLENAPVCPISILLVKMAPVFISGRNTTAMEEDLLRRAGLAFAATFRASDIMARLGDCEFGVLLPRTDASTAQNLAERLHKALLKHAPERRDVLVEFSVVPITCQEPGCLSETLQQNRSL
jgi:GGDEF domain-containing protein